MMAIQFLSWGILENPRNATIGMPLRAQFVDQPVPLPLVVPLG